MAPASPATATDGWFGSASCDVPSIFLATVGGDRDNIVAIVAAKLTTPIPGADTVRTMHHAHEKFRASGTIPDDVRDIVADSWRFSASAGVDADDVAVP